MSAHVKMKVGVLANNPVFGTSFKKLMQLKLPVKTSFALRGVNKVIQNEVQKYAETKDQLLMECASRDEHGNIFQDKLPNGQMTVRLDTAKIQEYNKRATELSQLEVDVPAIRVDDLGTPDDLPLTPEDYSVLEFIVE